MAPQCTNWHPASTVFHRACRRPAASNRMAGQLHFFSASSLRWLSSLRRTWGSPSVSGGVRGLDQTSDSTPEALRKRTPSGRLSCGAAKPPCVVGFSPLRRLRSQPPQRRGCWRILPSGRAVLTRYYFPRSPGSACLASAPRGSVRFLAGYGLLGRTGAATACGCVMSTLPLK
jgi:hypothetical protein